MTKKENKSIEEAFEALDDMIEELENPKLPMEEAFRLYRQGMELLKYCNEKIDTIEKKMLQMNEDGDVIEF